jgi:hypothetical protein
MFPIDNEKLGGKTSRVHSLPRAPLGSRAGLMEKTKGGCGALIFDSLRVRGFRWGLQSCMNAIYTWACRALTFPPPADSFHFRLCLDRASRSRGRRSSNSKVKIRWFILCIWGILVNKNVLIRLRLPRSMKNRKSYVQNKTPWYYYSKWVNPSLSQDRMKTWNRRLAAASW